MTMLIHEMPEKECSEVLEQARLGRLACARDNQPYIIPISVVVLIGLFAQLIPRDHRTVQPQGEKFMAGDLLALQLVGKLLMMFVEEIPYQGL